MKTNHFLLWTILTVSLFTACRKERPPVTIETYKEYIEHPGNGLVKTQEYNGIQYSLRYLPLPYQALKNFNPKVDAPAIFAENMEELKGHHYLMLQLRPGQKGKSLKNQYEVLGRKKEWSQVVSEMDFQLKEKFQLHINGAKLPCRLYHAFKGINTSGEQYFLLIFKDDTMDDSMLFGSDLKLEFDDLHFAGKSLFFHFKKEILNQVPKLKSFETYAK